MWTNLGIKASSIDLKKEVIDVTRISNRRNRPPGPESRIITSRSAESDIAG
jgi:hypothetical protein